MRAVFENGIESHRQLMAAKINNDGFYVRHSPGYSYTVGCSILGLPELMVEQLPPDHADEILGLLYLAAKEFEGAITCWEDLSATLEPKPAFLPMTENSVKQCFFDGRTHFGHWNFSGTRLVLATG